MPSEKGRFFLKFMVRAMICSLKKVPGVELSVEIYEAWRDAASDVRAEQDQASYEERIARLEEASQFSPSEAQTLSKEVIAEMRKQGEVISEAQEKWVAELTSVVPSLIRERTQAILRQARSRGTAVHTALPISEQGEASQAFYQSLFPRRRPRFQVDDPVPHRSPPWYVVQLLGIGGFGEVWEVRRPHLPDRFAVKFCLDQASAKVLNREAEALIALSNKLPHHPHIVRLIELQLDQEPYWLAFEYINGGSLEALLRTGPLSWEDTLTFFRPLVEAMSAVHRVGIVHRDLKPANILLTAQHEVKIADFGIGKVLADQEVQSQQTRTCFTAMGYGSIGYMSEEQAAGKPAHPADDTFALGVLLWQMLSGSLSPPPRYVHRLVDKLPVPPAIQKLILDCVNEPRNERPQNTMTLLEVLDKEIDPPQQSESHSSLWVPPSKNVVGTSFRDKLKDSSEGPEMVYIPTGKFKMGDDGVFTSEEKPAHWVTIAYTLAIGKYPVTVGEFKKFVQATNYRTEAEKGDGAYSWTGEGWEEMSDANWKHHYFSQTDRNPVICVSWNDAQSYCRWLSEQTGKPYRLLSEAEWEYACRAGTTTQYSFGDYIPELKNYAWYDENSTEGMTLSFIDKLLGKGKNRQTHPVGEKKPNSWGLCDMHGNVSEWCEDVWHDNYDGAPTDGSAWVENGEQHFRLLRGGSWNYTAYRCRSAYRSRSDRMGNDDGFRLCVPLSC